MIFAHPDLFSDDKADLFLELEELKMLISNAIDGLPTQCKTIYQLSRNEGLTNKKISELLGITIKTVENQMTIAIRKIKDFLRPYQDQIFIFFIGCKFFLICLGDKGDLSAVVVRSNLSAYGKSSSHIQSHPEYCLKW